jgi:hypothetical protein
MKIDRTKLLSLCLAVVPAVTLACGGSSADSVGSGGSDLATSGAPVVSQAEAGAPASTNNAAPSAAPPAATVNPKPLNLKTATCTAVGSAPTVSIPSNKATEKAINDVLAPLASPCQQQAGDIQSDFEVTALLTGLLSIRVTGSMLSRAPPTGRAPSRPSTSISCTAARSSSGATS